MTDEVKVLDAGGELMLSGADRELVEAKLQYYVGRGSAVISPATQVGSTWVAACTAPAQVHAADKTTTLNLAEILKAQNTRAAPRSEPVSDGVCTIEKIGFKRMITGPSEAAVRAITRQFIELGAGIESGPEEIFGQWTAVCDLSGAGPEQTLYEP